DHLSLSVYPNPADEEIYVTALLPVEYAADQASGAIEMRMYSSIGKEVYRVACAPGETVIIPTSRMPAGMYVIRANPASQSRTTHPLHTSQTVIINR
ncbi:MAG: T9SS type A sorting domain-containing protein, partial [Candidatus Kapaibacterium sp.]